MKASDLPDREVLEVIRRHWDEGGPWVDEHYASLDVPFKVVLAKLAKLDKRGLLEWGTSLRTAWLSPEGRAALEQLGDK